MAQDWIPMRWPLSWKDPSALDLLKDTVINCLVIEPGADLGPVLARANQHGLQVMPPTTPPPGVTIVEGEWPGVKMTESGAVDHASAGPTGAPWVDSNGWRVRLSAAIHPEDAIWVSATPKKPRLFTESYQMGVADAAAHGGRWVISLDDRLAAGLAGKDPDALETWRKMTGAAGFFAARKDWLEYVPEAVMGIISDFSGPNEFMTHEILNLVARTNQQYRVLLKTGISQLSFKGLRAILYADEQPPAPDLKRRILTFVEAGGMLITGPKWGELPGIPLEGDGHPRYALRVMGKGRVAVARPDFEDPYLVANDSLVLISHRYELLRFWNGGAVGSYFTRTRDGKRAVVQMLFYADARFGKMTVRIAGQYRTARLRTLGQPDPQSVEMEIGKDAVELHLPTVSQYAAAELEV